MYAQVCVGRCIRVQVSVQGIISLPLCCRVSFVYAMLCVPDLLFCELPVDSFVFPSYLAMGELG